MAKRVEPEIGVGMNFKKCDGMHASQVFEIYPDPNSLPR